MGLFGNKKKETAKIEEKAVKAEQVIEPEVEAKTSTDDELIAVMAAAIAAYEAEAFVQTLYVRKINRTAGVKPAWGTAGLNEAIDAGRF